MSHSKILDGMNQHAPGFITMLGGRVTALDPDTQSCEMTFDISTDFCHSVDIVQGGFVTAMLDAAMSHAAFGLNNVATVSSLEIKTSYLAPTRAGTLRAVGRILKMSYKLAFFEGQLFDADNQLTATGSSVAKIARAPADA